MPMTEENGASVPAALRPVSTVSLVFLTTFHENSHVLTIPPTLALTRLGAGGTARTSRFVQRPYGRGYIVRGLLDAPLPERRPRRVLPMGQQV
jgi:hypothetical protein